MSLSQNNNLLQLGCGFGDNRGLEAVVERRKNSTVAWLHRVVIFRRAGRLPDYQLIHRVRKSVPRVDARIEEELPDLP